MDAIATPPPRPGPFRLGDLEVWPDSNEVRSSAGTQRLRPLLMQLLLRLAADPGQVVRRETLLTEAWPRRMVNDEVLSRAIAELRTALGDDAKQSRYVETLPKVGYRLIAETSPLAAPAAPAKAGPRFPPAFYGVTLTLALLAIATMAWHFRPEAAVASGELAGRLTHAVPFSSDAAFEVGPRFSADGGRIVYAVGEGTESRLVIRALDGTIERTIGAPGTLRLSPIFLPDGKRIVYYRRQGEDCAIVEHVLASGAERVLVDCATEPRPRFDLAPDGRQLAYTARTRANYPAGLMLADLETGARRVLTEPEPGMGDDLLPRFSPDGKRLVYFRGTESSRTLRLVELANPTATRDVVANQGFVYGAAWLATGEHLLVAADWLAVRALHEVVLATGEVRFLGARGARFPDVSARGDIVWENAQYSANLWRVDLAGAGAPSEAWASTRYTAAPEFSPDGRHVVFASNREVNDSIFVAPVDGEARRLPLAPEYRYMRPHWSADGRAIYAVRTEIGMVRRNQVAVRISWPAGRAEEVLEGLGTRVGDVRESADGRWLYVGETSGHAMRILRATRDTARDPQRLSLPLISEFQAPGGRLVFSQPELTGLTTCRDDGTACERLDVPVSDANRYHWLVAGNGLYVRAPGPPAELVRIDLATGKREWRHAHVPTTVGNGIALDPAGRTLLIAREGRTSVDLAIARR